MRVTVLAFARLRELAGFSERVFEFEAGNPRVEDVWLRVARDAPPIAALRRTTRFARNGALAAPDQTVNDGDEVALLPPVGGG